MARRPEALGITEGADVEVVGGDVLDPASLAIALKDIDTAFYLIHSMKGEGHFAELDRRAAQNFAAAAKEAGVQRIIYLGGLGAGSNLSPHLASRQEVGRILADSGIPTIEFRASVIIGSGSISFEMIRSLVEKLPVMVTPHWVRCQAQPIGIDDVIAYLAAAIEMPLEASRIFEIGGPQRVSYDGIMREYARQRGLRRWMIPVPVLTPYLSSLWLRFVTPLYVKIGRALIEGIKNPTIVSDTAAKDFFDIQPVNVRDAIATALQAEDQTFAGFRAADVDTRAAADKQRLCFRSGWRIVDMYWTDLPVGPAKAFEPVRHIGGASGWHFANGLWTLRKLLDALVGGPGFRASDRDPENVTCGDVIDFWRVEAVEPDGLLRLRAEMKLPGRAWLQFEVVPSDCGSTLYQTAVFDPRGLGGLLYWYACYPLHRVLFRGMLNAIGKRAC
jgi:uncharacterized protein YbjT (DUF2867 family)